MKRLISAMVLLLVMIAVSVTAYAENVNLLSDYSTGWSGNVSYDSNYSTVNVSEGVTAVREFETNGEKGLYFYFDMGTLSGKNAGCLAVEMIDENGKVLKSYSTADAEHNGSFRRYSLGSNDGYYVLPDGTATVRITLESPENECGTYYRNFCLYISSDATRDESVDGFSVSGNLTLVQNNVSGAQYWIMVVFVFLVALGMFFVRKNLDRIKNRK